MALNKMVPLTTVTLVYIVKEIQLEAYNVAPIIEAFLQRSDDPYYVARLYTYGDGAVAKWQLIRKSVITRNPDYHEIVETL
jgi:hypothetical protein